MSFSTWSHEFRERQRPTRHILALMAGVVLVPVLWLASLQAAFDLAYPACWWGTSSLLFAAVLTPVPLIAALGWLVSRIEPRRSASGDQPWPSWLATLALLTCGFFLIVAAAMLVPVVGLDPCQQ